MAESSMMSLWIFYMHGSDKEFKTFKKNYDVFSLLLKFLKYAGIKGTADWRM